MVQSKNRLSIGNCGFHGLKIDGCKELIIFGCCFRSPSSGAVVGIAVGIVVGIAVGIATALFSAVRAGCIADCGVSVSGVLALGSGVVEDENCLKKFLRVFLMEFLFSIFSTSCVALSQPGGESLKR